MSTTIQYILIIISIVLSAFFSGSENAIGSCNRMRLEKQAEEGKKSAVIASRLVEDFPHTISTILMGNNLVNILASTVATILFVSYFPKNGEAIAAVVMTVVLLIFGEILPKLIAVEYADSLVTVVAWPLRIVMIIFAPVVYFVTWLVNLISPIWTPKEEAPSATTDELVTMVEEIEEEGVITEKESELIRSAIEFTDVNARDIMTPRVDVAAFDIDDGIDALLDNHDLLQYSRFPVYRENFDNVIGILSSRKVIKETAAGHEIDIEAMLKPVLFVHMTRPISSILHELTANHLQMAVVVDEYGGSMGILTREDIIEEIVGEIYDETDEEEGPDVMDAGMGSYIVDAGISIEDMFEAVGYAPDSEFESEYATAGGWATEMLDRFPSEGDSFNFDTLTITVIEAQPKRVEKLLVTIRTTGEEEEK